MALSDTFALSRSLRFYVVEESTSGTLEKPAAADGARVNTVSMAKEKTFIDRNDSRETRSLLQRIPDRYTVPWEVNAGIIPSGTLGTPPDLHALFKAAMGTYTNTPATSDAYTLANTQTIDTLSMSRAMNGTFMAAIWGAWVDEMSISVSGTSLPTVRFAGGAMGYAATGRAVLDGAMVASTAMVVTTARAAQMMENSVIVVDADDNGGLGHLITAADYDTETFTLADVATAADSSVAVPFNPVPTTTGTPISHIVGSFTFNGASYPITAAEINVVNGLRPVDDVFSEESPQCVTVGFRSVTGSLTLRLSRAHQQIWHERLKYENGIEPPATVIVLGETGRKVTIFMPDTIIDYGAVDVPEGDGDVIANVPFVAVGSAGEDELSVNFN